MDCEEMIDHFWVLIGKLRRVPFLINFTVDGWDEECKCRLSFEMLCELSCVVSCYRWRSLWYVSSFFSSKTSTGRLAQLVARQIPNLKVRSSILLLVIHFRSLFQVLSPSTADDSFYLCDNTLSQYWFSGHTAVLYTSLLKHIMSSIGHHRKVINASSYQE